MHHRLLILSLVVSLFAVAAPTSQAASPTGLWSGSWCSQTSGHSGPVKAHIRRIDCDSYRAVFVGRFAGVIPFLYPATLERVAGTDQYTSNQRLPFMGSYRMTATITDCDFHADYEGCFHGEVDRGTFEMRRK